jgi:hypothetical protein
MTLPLRKRKYLRGLRNSTMPDESQQLSKELLFRLDERTKNIQDALTKNGEELKNSFIALSDKIRDTERRQDQKSDDNKKAVAEIIEMLEANYTKKTEFDPIRKIVYGFVGFLLLSMGGMFIAVLNKPNAVAQFSPPAIQGPATAGAR